MRALVIALVCLTFAIGAEAGDNPNVNIFLEFQNGENYINPAPFTTITVTIYLENFGPGGGTTGVELMLVRSFGGLMTSHSPLPSGWIEFEDPESGWMVTGACAMPDGNGRVAVAEVTYFYDGTPGTIEIVDYPARTRGVVDCAFNADQWCVRLSPSGHGGVGVLPPPGDCAGDPHPHRWDVPSEMATIQAAIDTAWVFSDTVLVAPGTYATSTNGEVFPIVMRSGVKLMSESGAPSTIIDAEQQDRVIEGSSLDPTTLIEGFTVTGGQLENGGEGAGLHLSGSPEIRACVISDNEIAADQESCRGGGMYFSGAARIVDCTFSANILPSGFDPQQTGSALFSYWSGRATVTGCDFSGNLGGADVVAFWGANGAVIADCSIHDNTCGWEALAVETGTDPFQTSVTNCIVHHNSGSKGMRIYSVGAGSFLVSDCTFSHNEGGIFCEEADSLTIKNTVVSFSEVHRGVTCDMGSPTLVCTNVYGNAGGDWVGCIADQYGQAGNISEDPLFCNPDNDDFALCADSWCAAENNPGCGQIGAFGVGCGDCGSFHVPPSLIGVEDVGNDQGRNVRLRWLRSTYDTPGAPYQVTSYEVHRRQDGQRDGGAKGPGAESTADGVAGRTRIDGWDYVATIPVHGDSVYQYVAPTLCDSTAEGGICWSVFLIRGTTADPYTYFDSPPDSGYSVDNLAPAPPAGLLASGDHSLVTLTWDPSEEEDFDYYAVYRDIVEDFEPGDPIGLTSDPTFDDTDPPGASDWWYKVTAFDFSGNESDPSEEAGIVTTGVSDALPSRFWLGPAVPTPFPARTEIQYWVPAGQEACRVTLTVYDARGRVVRHLIEGDMPPGAHAVSWDAKDDGGAPVASGVYFYSMEAGDYANRRKMVLIR